MTNIPIINKELCTGCGACSNICPNDAITMEESTDGFLYPIINSDKCTNCGLCKKICPLSNLKYSNKKPNTCYAYMAKDEIRIKSSSGGAFYELAKYFIKNNGYVSGVVLNKEYEAMHIVSNIPEDIERMRGSKYIQSNTKHCYKEIKELLEKNIKILFTGTPCQVAGLKSYINKDYKNLYCIDIVCHGVPSKIVFKKYIEEECLENNNEKWISTQFRDKSYNGWRDFYVTTITDNNHHSVNQKDDIFIKAFLKDICLRISCEKCPYSKFPRQGDITIGDFWGIDKYNKDFDDKKGTSVIFVNNNKGKTLLNILKNDAKLCKKVNKKYAINNNPNLIKPSVFHKNRRIFFKDLETKSLKDSLEKNINDKCDIMILNYWFAVNYGAILSCYGLQCLLEKLGQETKVINFTPNFSPIFRYKNSFSNNFGLKYLNLSNKCSNYTDFINLNKYCKTFITGSDQVFAPDIMKTHCGNLTESIYLLDFVSSNNKKLSYSASMGNFNKNATYNDKKIFKHYLIQFDNISVREDKAVNILSDEFNITAEQLIDGAFHIPKEKLLELTANYTKQENYVLYIELPYHNNDIGNEIKLAAKISDKLNLPLKHIEYNQERPVEEWLAYIKNANFVVSTSYHAIIFAIIFNVPFVQIHNKNSHDRFTSLYKILNIQDNSVSSYQEADFDKILIKNNWDEINDNIKKEVQKAEMWLQNALNQETINKEQYDFLNYLYFKMHTNKKAYDKKIKLLADKDKIKKEYIKNKILSKILFGKYKKLYKQQYKINKKQLEQINKLSQ